jgi:hypothetical protein
MKISLEQPARGSILLWLRLDRCSEKPADCRWMKLHSGGSFSLHRFNLIPVTRHNDKRSCKVNWIGMSDLIAEFRSRLAEREAELAVNRRRV